MSQTTSPARRVPSSSSAAGGAAQGGGPAVTPGAPDAPANATPVTGLAPQARVGTRLSGALGSLQRAFAGTPGRLRELSALAVLGALVFGLGAGQAFRAQSDALARAGANAEQLVRVQAIHTLLVRADADATNSFLVGGVEPAAERAQYTASVSQASGLIAQAARAQPADSAALASLNATMVGYVGLIESARANNRQALPVGAQYLRGASSSLRADALPVLENLATANESRTQAEFDAARRAWLWLIVTGMLALALLVGGMVWLARRTHRLLNLPLAVAAVVVLVALAAGVAGLSSVSTTVASVRAGPYDRTLAAAAARVAAFDAKSNESLTLIARGSGASSEKAWQALSSTVTASSQRLAARDPGNQMPALWQRYVATHTAVRKADDGGAWDAAVALATGTSPQSANATFGAFDRLSSTVLDEASTATTAELSTSHSWLLLAGIAGLLAGLTAAVFAWWGVALRLEEYR